MLGLMARAGFVVLLSPWLHAIVLLFALAGLVIGLAVNAIFSFRRPVLFYALGHIAMLAVALSFGQKNRAGPEESKLMKDVSPAPAPGDVLPPPDKQAIEKVIYTMEEQYPLGAYEIGDIVTEYINNDSTGNSGLTCFIVYTLPEVGGKKYISKYFIKADSLSAIYTKKDTFSAEYKVFLHSPRAY